MAWNTGKSILDTGDTGQDVEREADVIFSAAFIGMTLFQNKKREGLTWRIDMEPNTDPLGQRMPDRNARTKDDRDSMRTLNDVCSKVNQVIRTSLGKDVGGVGADADVRQRRNDLCRRERSGRVRTGEPGVREDRLPVPHRPAAGVE